MIDGATISGGTSAIVNDDLSSTGVEVANLRVYGTSDVVGGCPRSSTIAGPVAATGTMNIDPKFISIAAENFRLSAGSPARDLSDSGPSRDFENDPRPEGDRFDIGADESPLM